VAASLLPDQDDQRHAALAGVGERVDRVAQPGDRVQVDQRRGGGGDRVPARHPHDRVLMQREHEAQILGQVGQKRDLDGARIAEDRPQPELAHDVEGRLADTHRADPFTLLRRRVSPTQRRAHTHDRADD